MMTLEQAMKEVERQKNHCKLLTAALKEERRRRKDVQRIAEKLKLKLCKVGHRVSCSCFIELGGTDGG